jgi:hypothetical protein
MTYSQDSKEDPSPVIIQSQRYRHLNPITYTSVSPAVKKKQLKKSQNMHLKKSLKLPSIKEQQLLNVQIHNHLKNQEQV